MAELTGGCLCGSIRYKIINEPILAYTCHCRFCQKDTGTAHRSALAVLNEQVQLSGKEIKVYTYKSDDHGRELLKTFAQIVGLLSHLKLKDFRNDK